MKKHYLKYRYFAAIAAIIAVGLLAPAAGEIIRNYRLLQIGIFISFLITGAELQLKNLLDIKGNTRPLVAAIISSFVLFPIAVVGLAKIFLSGYEDLFVGICLLSVLPVSAITAMMLTRVAGGNITLNLLINVTTNMLALLTVPLSLKFLLSGIEIYLPAREIMTKILLIVILPITVGGLLRPFVAKTMIRFERQFLMFSKIIVLMIILNAVSNSAERILQIGPAVILIFILTAILHVIILSMNTLIAKAIKLDSTSASAFIITASQKTLVLSFIIWSGFFSHLGLAILPSICYHLTQTVAGTYLARWLGGKKERDNKCRLNTRI